MSRRWVWVFFLVSLVVAFAHGPSQAATTANLSGTVKDNAGVAVTAAEVQVLSPGTESVVASASTDGSGFYQLSIATGTYDVKVVPPADSGFQPTLVLNRDIAADTTLNFVLVPTGMATLHGRVLDRDGNGVPGQTVSLSPSGGSVTTDALGGYAFEVAPGTY
ncbi:MAG: carboxypeptidase regulatory-like domain-containing protein, partial [Gaiellaceae bacterium]